ncbi:MAG TPA: hypothetical protein VJ183_01490 [Chloroflexia bacterium]|nr:hypothetical protein [Chloroflexia bacterium]
MTHIQGRVIISFSLPLAIVTLHEPVLVDFSIRNGLEEGIQFDLGHNRKRNFDITITEADGPVIQVPRLSEEDLGRLGKLCLKPQEKYTQRLLLNEWYDFAEPGSYKIEGRLSTPIQTLSGREANPGFLTPMSLQVLPRNPERLRKVCQALLHTAVESADVAEATEAVLALSHIRDPLAVPYLEEALSKRRLVWPYAIPGLARIANAEAIEVLISTMEGRDPEAGASLARAVLYEVQKKTKDTGLREKIEVALRS